MDTTHSTKRAHNFKDLAGLAFGRWTVIGVHSRNKHGQILWLCRCQCGTEQLVIGSTLSFGRSLGCRRCGSSSHGSSRSPEYRIWNGMACRCYSPNDSNYHKYGQRGVAVCKGWRESFAVFFADMGERPSIDHSIDRIDNNGNYSCGHCEECLRNGWPANCRWATRQEQQRNTRQNHLVTHGGRTMCLAEWAKEVGIAPCALYHRLTHGWSTEKALTAPKHPGRRNF
jgi:hypothetical protein